MSSKTPIDYAAVLATAHLSGIIRPVHASAKPKPVSTPRKPAPAPAAPLSASDRLAFDLGFKASQARTATILASKAFETDPVTTARLLTTTRMTSAAIGKLVREITSDQATGAHDAAVEAHTSRLSVAISKAAKGSK